MDNTLHHFILENPIQPNFVKKYRVMRKSFGNRDAYFANERFIKPTLPIGICTIIAAIIIGISLIWIIIPTLRKTIDGYSSTTRFKGAYMINLPQDTWKLERYEKSRKDNHVVLDTSIWKGVVVGDSPHKLQWAIDKGYTRNILDKSKHGNIGSALAHLTLWDHIANSGFHDDESVYLIMEDNVLFTQESRQFLDDIQSPEGNMFDGLSFDIINLCVLRPMTAKIGTAGCTPHTFPAGNSNKGISYSSGSGLECVKKGDVKEPLPNVWLSSYMVTTKGCRKLLEAVADESPDISTDIIDRVVSRIVSKYDMSAYIFQNCKLFNHIETGHDSRSKLNQPG